MINALKAIVTVSGMSNMSPPIKDLLPRLAPILSNRQEAVQVCLACLGTSFSLSLFRSLAHPECHPPPQENVVDLIGRIADRAPEHVSAREWLRICFSTIELLKARKKAIRRAAVNTFGYIAKAVGPQDVIATLLNNLKVCLQEKSCGDVGG